MQADLVYIISFFILFNTLFHTKSAAQNSEPYQNCSMTFNCGNITQIGYPFWGSNRPEYCGHPELKLNCTNQTANIKLGNLNYRVLAINNVSKNLQVVREDHIVNICPEPYVNPTFDEEVLSYASDVQDISIYYGCPPSTSVIQTSQPTMFSCNDSEGFYAIPGSGDTPMESDGSCTTLVLVPATMSAIQISKMNPSISFDE
ncbi:Protein kinase superfamily protein [Euphorbia peplus]|nr:Protein kinase superfamily protein [Euphorbia peplus]